MSEMDQLMTRKGSNDRGLYSSRSGNYASYMVARAGTKDITTAIQKANNCQMVENAVIGGRINSNITRMQTGIQTAINTQTYSIIASQNELKRTMQNGFDSVNNTLDIGFAGVNNAIGNLGACFSAGMSDLSWQVSKMTDKICDKLDQIHDIVNNPLLTQSRELYRRAVANYKKGFFEEGLEDAKSAVEKNKTDYLSWFLLGQFYLYGVSEFSNVVNVAEAITAFSNAVKYIKPDVSEIPEAQKLASEMYFHLAYAEYITANDMRLQNNTALYEENLDKAITNNTISYQLSDTLYEALYQEARCKLLQGKKDESLQLIKQAVLGDKNYCLKATADPDLSAIVNDIYSLIKSLKNEIFSEAKVKYIKLHDLMPRVVFGEGQFAAYVQGLVQLYYSNISDFTSSLPYFDVRNAYENYDTIYQCLTEEKPCDQLMEKISSPYFDDESKEILRLKGENKFIACTPNTFASGSYNEEPGTVQKFWYEWDAYSGKGKFHYEALNKENLDSLHFEEHYDPKYEEISSNVNYYNGDNFLYWNIARTVINQEGKEVCVRDCEKELYSTSKKWKICGKEFLKIKDAAEKEDFVDEFCYISNATGNQLPEIEFFEANPVDRCSLDAIFFQDKETLFIMGRGIPINGRESGKIEEDEEDRLFLYVFKPSVWIKPTEEKHREKIDKENAERATKKAEAEKLVQEKEDQQKKYEQKKQRQKKAIKISCIIDVPLSLVLTFLMLQIKTARVSGKLWINLGVLVGMAGLSSAIVRIIAKQKISDIIFGSLKLMLSGLLAGAVPGLLIRFIPFGKSIVSFIVIEIVMATYLILISSASADDEYVLV
jgi:uncharacterized protein YceK